MLYQGDVCYNANLQSAALIGPISDRGELNPDTSTGVFFSTMLGLSFLFLGLMPGARMKH